MHALKFPSTICIVAASLVLLVGCQKKAKIEAETAEYSARVVTLSPEVLRLGAELKALDLGNAQNPELRMNDWVTQVDLLKAEMIQLRERLAEQRAKVEEAEKTLNVYREKYGNS
jgi:outer membrane murein-binding lipoprotein Lpp